MSDPDWARWRRDVDLERYDEQWQQMAERGENPHGEVDFVGRYAPASVLDGGCGTGRVAIELARRGVDVVGVDLDPDMIAAARAKTPELTWVRSSLAALDLARTFAVVVLAGNVIPFVAPDERAAAVAGCARHLAPGGHLISGFSLRSGWPPVADYDEWCATAGLIPVERFSTWDAAPFAADSDYAVSVHRTPSA